MYITFCPLDFHVKPEADLVISIYQVDINLSDIDALLLEPASCAAHGLDMIPPNMGPSLLMFNAGLTGLVLAQMLRQNGCCRVVIAAPEGMKKDLGRILDAADVYLALRAEMTYQRNLAN